MAVPFGVGLRPVYQPTILEQQPQLDWLEITTENYLGKGGRALYYLDQLRERYPIILHGVSLSIGSIDPLDKDYLQAVKQLAQRVKPMLISDHCCWTGVDGYNLHDLMPLPYTEETVLHVVERILQVQDFLGQQILLENVSSYISYHHNEMKEWDFLSSLAEKSGCGLLLDVNNVYVSAYNHGFDPLDYLKGIASSHVKQFHLAGHQSMQGYILDTHAAAISQDVWDLYRIACELYPQAGTIIERDDCFPDWDALYAEVTRAREIHNRVRDICLS